LSLHHAHRRHVDGPSRCAATGHQTIQQRHPPSFSIPYHAPPNCPLRKISI
jgi:hypothetical protein